jgi:WhiB family transcriptional regulator, redox-sensing transcriptional regulator
MSGSPTATSANASWRRQAACLQADPSLFTDPRPGTEDTRRALAICARCPVQAACLTDALRSPADADVGIWGATTERTRHAMRREAAARRWPWPPTVGLFPTLEGDLTDLTGRALITELPDAPRHLLFIDGQPSLRTDHLQEVWHRLTVSLQELRPEVLEPFALTSNGELSDPSGRLLITRLPAPPHLLIVLDGRPHSRSERLDEARERALAALELRRKANVQAWSRPGSPARPMVAGSGPARRASVLQQLRPAGPR